jgi:hypothetical protein
MGRHRLAGTGYIPELEQDLRNEARARLDRALANLPPRTQGRLLHGHPRTSS